MKRILILDTETLDLPDNINLSEEELSNIGVKDNNDVPLAYQLSYLFDNGQKRFFADCIGKPILPISIASSEITHVTNKDIEELTLKEDGSYLKLTENKEFKDLVNLVETVNNEEIYLVGHNVKYDIEIMRREGLDLSKCKAIDTLQLARFLDKESEAHRLTYLLYAKEEVLNATRELVKLDQIKNVAKIQPMSAHNSLFDVVSTNYLLTHYRDRLLEMNKDLTLDTVYEELHKISTTPFLIEEVPFGGSKGKLIKELNENEILWIYKMDIDEMNFRYSLEERMNDFGGLDAIIKKMSNFDIEKLLSSNPEYFKLEELKVKLNKELDSRSGGIVTLGFGKYKDVNIQEVKHDYLIWLRDNNSGNLNTLKKVETELKRRSEGEPSKSIDEEKPKIDAIENSQTLLEDFLND